MTNKLPFVFRMAWRESRANWSRFAFFFVCIAIGIGGIVAVGLFSGNIERTILRNARSLLGGDLEIRSERRMTADSEAVVHSLSKRGIAIAHVSELLAMAAPAGQGDAAIHSARATQLVELKVVEEPYPLYGTVELNPPGPLMPLLQSLQCEAGPCFGAVVQESLLYSLGVEVGEFIKIGQATFVVSGVLEKEPDRVAVGVSLGPRVMIARQALAATELVKTGSRIRERYLLRVPESYFLEALLGELQARLAKDQLRVSSYRDAQPRIKRFLDQLSTYLGLIGLAALFVGGIGVALTIEGFIAQKMNTVAVLKTLGAEPGFIMQTYLLQSLLMGGIGALAGLVLGVGLFLILPSLLHDLIPLPLTTDILAFPLLNGVALGLATTGLFTIWPLLRVRHIPPALVFRRDIGEQLMCHKVGASWKRVAARVRDLAQDRLRVLAGFVTSLGLCGVALWQARAFWLGLFFILAFAAAVLILTGAMKLWSRIIAGMRRPRSFVLREALGQIQRPGSHAAGIVIAIGIGVMVIVTIGLVKTALLTAIGERMPTDAPTFYFIDIQPDQKRAFEALIKDNARGAEFQTTPVVRSRLASLNGKRIDPEAHKQERNGWYFTREYVVTALEDLPWDNEIVKGEWWGSGKDMSAELPTAEEATIQVSVEDEAARNLLVDLGSTVEFDIQGASLVAQVSSLRKVDWGSFALNFFMILSPHGLDGAPYTYIGSAKVAPEDEVPLQRALVAQLPNVTAIKIGDVLRNITRLLEQLAWAIQGMAGLCIISGAVVMAAAISTTRFRRLYEAAIVKAVGGTRMVILRILAVEFALLGALAGLIGIALASVLSWAVLIFSLELPWTFQPMTLGVGFSLTMLLAVTVGLLSTFRILGQPPMGVLRQE